MTQLYLHCILESILTSSNFIEIFLYNKAFLCIIPIFCVLSAVDRFHARSQNCEKQLLASSCLSVCLSVCPSAWNNTSPGEKIFVKFNTWEFFENISIIIIIITIINHPILHLKNTINKDYQHVIQ